MDVKRVGRSWKKKNRRSSGGLYGPEGCLKGTISVDPASHYGKKWQKTVQRGAGIEEIDQIGCRRQTDAAFRSCLEKTLAI
jgi:hypothetical protein